MRRLGLVLMVIGAGLLATGVLGRFAFGEEGSEAAAGASPASSPTEVTGPSPTEATGPSPSEEPTATQTPSAEPSDEPAEAPEEFFERFADAIRNEDVAFLLARLHPVVLEIYGRPQCRSQVATIQSAPGFDIEVRRVEGPGPYDYAPDDQGETVEDAYTVAVTFTSSTTPPTRQDVHVAVLDGELRWFTDCGDQLT